jgi:competence transcription factor ComK
MMLDNNTISKLYEMRLSVMAQSFDEQIKNGCFAEMSFEERFGMLVDSEWAARKSNRLTRLNTEG